MKRTIIISLLLVLFGSMPLMAQNFQLSKVSTNIQTEKKIVTSSDKKIIQPKYVREKTSPMEEILIFFLLAIAGLVLVILIEKVRGMYEFWHFGLVNWYFVGIIIFFSFLCVNDLYSSWLSYLCIITTIVLWIIWYRFSKRCKRCKKWGSMKVFNKELIEQRDSLVKENDTYLPATTYIFHIHRRCKACGHEDYLRSKKKEKN